MPAERPTRLKRPWPEAKSAKSPYQGRDRPLFTAGGVASTGTFTIVINILNTETVTIDGKVYTWQTVLTDVDGNVLIGATAEDSLDNLVAAINLGAGAGTLYAASMTLHPTVTAVDGAGTTVDVTAKFTGTAGDAITTTEGIVDGGAAWGGATLAAGADADEEESFVPVIQWSSMRIRVRISGGAGTLAVQFARPARDKAPNTDGTAFLYTVDIPAVNGTVLVDGVEQSIEITDVEHQGENWLRLGVAVDNSDAEIDFLDLSGVNVGQGS
jgi:hypothetical protein